jgi:hypothetical protein
LTFAPTFARVDQVLASPVEWKTAVVIGLSRRTDLLALLCIVAAFLWSQDRVTSRVVAALETNTQVSNTLITKIEAISPCRCP